MFQCIYILCQISSQVLGVDIQDDLGRHEVGFIEDTIKKDINKGQGCRMRVKFKINKVPGNFHVSTHASVEKPEHASMEYVCALKLLIELYYNYNMLSIQICFLLSATSYTI